MEVDGRQVADVGSPKAVNEAEHERNDHAKREYQ